MTDDADEVERIALDLIERFGDAVVPIARELAAASIKARDEMLISAETWRDIIDVIERLLSNYGKAQWLTIH
jgi:hypothetical protein